jgi:drug/metabolite transporter (DMT)-like permease
VEAWVLVALACPLFWAVSNIIDKIAVDLVIETPMQFMFLLSQFYSLIFVVWAVALGDLQALSILAVGVGVLLFVLYYLYAVVLSGEDITSVIATHQSQPLFVLILAALILKEVPSSHELLGFLLVLLGIFWFTYSPRKSGALPLISMRSAIILAISAFVGACATILADTALADMSVLDIVGQSALGYGGAGLFALLITHYRLAALNPGRLGMARKTGLIFGTGLLDLLGYVAFYEALRLSDSPGMVAVVTSIHPIYVFALSAALAHLYPMLMRENNGDGRMIRKAIGSLIVVLGVITLS